MKNSFVWAATLVASSVACPTWADDLLNRLEVATEKIGAKQGEFYVSRAPELADKLPDWEWDDEIRTASKCVLDGIEAAKGRAIAEAYVSGLEADANKEVTSLATAPEDSSIPAELLNGDDTILNLMQTCKTMEISTIRLKESGFWDAMMDPEVMKKLTAE